jgi:hypothetical protein
MGFCSQAQDTNAPVASPKTHGYARPNSVRHFGTQIGGRLLRALTLHVDFRFYYLQPYICQNKKHHLMPSNNLLAKPLRAELDYTISSGSPKNRNLNNGIKIESR